jgi:hypothetical protein
VKPASAPKFRRAVTVFLGDPAPSRRSEARRPIQRRRSRHREALEGCARRIGRLRIRILGRPRSDGDAAAQGSAGVRAQSVRRRLQERRVQGAARSGALGDARHSLHRRRPILPGCVLRQGAGACRRAIDRRAGAVGILLRSRRHLGDLCHPRFPRS